MRAYLVRLRDDHQLVGVFTCELGYLAWFVDECSDPPDCEYTPLPQGGIYWSDRAQTVPIQTDTDTGEYTGQTSEHEFTEEWNAVMCGYQMNLVVWKPIPIGKVM
jgi:hypothetical protein